MEKSWTMTQHASVRTGVQIPRKDEKSERQGGLPGTSGGVCLGEVCVGRHGVLSKLLRLAHMVRPGFS